MLCQLCSTFDFNTIMRRRIGPDYHYSITNQLSRSDFDAGKRIWHFYLEGPDFLIPYHRTLEDLIDACEKCDLCQALLHSARGMLRFKKARNEDLCVSSSSGQGLFLCGLGKGQGIQLMAMDIFHSDSGCPSYLLSGGVGFYVARDSPIGQTIQGRTISESPQSTDSLNSISEWLSDCLTHHQHHISNTIKPTRVLLYEHEKGKVSLCTFTSTDIKYAALSHCWGTIQPLTLSTGNKHQLEEGLLIETFPKTFRDAFWLIHKLEIQYIWIDSLCIIQDSSDDWVHESARMCDVYGNAFLTIAAARAKNCSEGFLGPREGPKYGYVPFCEDGIYDNVAIFPLALRRISPDSEIIDLEEQPLSERAWALQERYLSPRTVHFATDQMYFECQSGFHAEDNHIKTGDNDPAFTIHKRMTSKDDKEPQYTWGCIVSRYTQRYLTVESDKLPAIGGLASRVFLERISEGDDGEEYLAGLWRTNLLWDLAWKTFYADALRSSPTIYTAPSWSWASINQPMEFLGPQDIQNLAIVKDAKVDLDTLDNPFGKVTGGWIHLSCIKLNPCKVIDDTEIYLGKEEATFRLAVARDPPRFNLPSVSMADYIDQKSGLVIVPLTLHFDTSNVFPEDDDRVRGAYFLILVSSDSSEGPMNDLPRYRRVGLGTSFESDDQYFKEAKNARRQMRDRCLAALEQGTLEDIILV